MSIRDYFWLRIISTIISGFLNGFLTISANYINKVLLTSLLKPDTANMSSLNLSKKIICLASSVLKTLK